jgi:hypothetical protein
MKPENCHVEKEHGRIVVVTKSSKVRLHRSLCVPSPLRVNVVDPIICLQHFNHSHGAFSPCRTAAADHSPWLRDMECSCTRSSSSCTLLLLSTTTIRHPFHFDRIRVAFSRAPDSRRCVVRRPIPIRRRVGDANAAPGCTYFRTTEDASAVDQTGRIVRPPRWVLGGRYHTVADLRSYRRKLGRARPNVTQWKCAARPANRRPSG